MDTSEDESSEGESRLATHSNGSGGNKKETKSMTIPYHILADTHLCSV